MSQQNLQMSKPTFDSLEELTNIQADKQFLLNTYGFKTIQQAKKAFGLPNAIDTYEFLFNDYNTNIKQINEANFKKYKKDLATYYAVQYKPFSKFQKYIKKTTTAYNDFIAFTKLVDATMSSQISTKFALGEHSFVIKNKNFTTLPEFYKTGYEHFKYDINEGKRILGSYFMNNENDKSYKKLEPLVVKNHMRFIVSEEIKISSETHEILFKRLYDELANNFGMYNRIFITNRENGKVSASLLESQITYEDFEKTLEKIIQSAGIAVLGELVFTVQYRNLPEGGKSVDVPQFLKDNGGVTLIINDDDLCGQRCLTLADCETRKSFLELRTPKFKDRFDKKLSLLCEELGLKGRMSFTDFDIYADLRLVQVIILSGLFVEMYATPTEFDDQIYIYYDTAINHYHYIDNINNATNDSKRNNKWCRYCKKSVRREIFDNHKCVESKCGCCNIVFPTMLEKDKHFSDAKKNKTWAKCELCNLWCTNDECLEQHSKKCSGCDVKCEKCKKWVKTKTSSGNILETQRIGFGTVHLCGEKYCRNCEKYYVGDHRCFITKLPEPIGWEWKQTIMSYDFEAMFNETNTHIVNLCIVKQLFSDNKFTFDTIEEFVKFAVEQKNTTFIAHNGKAYDNWMVHKYIIKHTAHRPNKIILAGNKIMYMKVKSVRFIDSLNHIAQGLATFPKTFGVKELKKGFFPYFFNVKENQNYIGSIPDKKYFNPASMSSDKNKEFNTWYDLQKGIYDFKKELYEYCDSDVDILKRCLEIYITDAINVTNINPISCSTIASYAMKVFRSNFINENQISILTKEEYDFCKRGFFGGRTEVFKMFQTWSETQIKEGVHGKYIDIQSLYPSVQFFDDLPCGSPVWDENPAYNNPLEYVKSNFGYIECDIECPQDLHIPLLPEKKNNKLIFDLVNKVKKVYTSIELKRAIEVGYKVTKIYRSVSFNKNKDMFKGYIQTFLKIKTECSGYDGDDIDDYIYRYNSHCGVLLEKNKIIKNSGMKLLAKILLNSLWGKFGQNDELPTTAYIKNDAWFRLLKRHASGKVELKNEVLIDDDTLYVSYIEKEEAQTSLMSTNLALAGFVTGQARLRLYKELFNLGERVIYCDTDSIIYEYRKSEYNVSESDLLGEWELEEGGDLQEVHALAPKTYGYKAVDGTEKYKCKGITLNHGNKEHFTYEKLKSLIKGDANGKRTKIITYSDDFIKDTKNGVIYTKRNVAKDTNYNVSDFKRVFYTDGTSSPFKN